MRVGLAELKGEKMAFVNEKIPAEFIQSFDFSVFHNYFGDPVIVYPSISTWTGDEGCGAFLIATDAGGGPHVGYQERKNMRCGGKAM